MEGGLREEMLTREPVRMVNMRQSHNSQDQVQPAVLRILELSNLDQLFDFYNSVALFYDAASTKKGMDASEHGSGMIVERLEGALEELLLHYPAAAGRLCISEKDGRFEVEYNPAPSSPANLSYGVPFAVAHADIAFCELGDVSAPHPSLDLLYPDLPKQSPEDSSGKYLPRPVLAVQLTTFTCGGFVLAHAGHHAFVDGHGAATLMQNWSSIARGDGLAVPPDTVSRREVLKPRIAAADPSQAPCIAKRPASANVQRRYGETTRFAISAAALESLRQRASAGLASKRCSRFVALAALLWSARAKSRVRSGNPPVGEEVLLRIGVNLRERGVPGLTRGYVGNAIFPCVVNATLQELCESSLTCVAGKIQAALVGMDRVECVQAEIDAIESQLRTGLVPSFKQSALTIPSLVSLPFYDTDFGWGRPIYCGRPSRQLSRLIVLDHPAAGAWNVLAVFSSEEEHAAFREEIAEYVTFANSL